MVATITPDVVELVTVPGVELIELGTWEASTGEFAPTLDDLQSAVAAYDDPAYNTPIIKLGHVPVRLVEWPAVGQIVNVRLNAAKTTLIGDLVGVPKWLADSMPTAFPRRSVEGEFDHKTTTGTKHKFVLTALSLLGENEPAISTLAEVKAMLLTGEGVLTPSATVSAGRVTLTRNERGEVIVSRPGAVAAAISVDTLREAFYASQPAGSWAWIRECYVGDNPYIIVDDDEGALWQIPWSEDDAKANKVAWGTPVKVEISYTPAASEPADTGLVLLSRNPIPATRPIVEASMPLTPEQLTEIGLAADADAEAVTTRLLELGAYAAAERDAALEAATAPGGGTTTELPEGMVAIPAEGLEDLRVAASQGRAAHEQLRVQNRDGFLNAAVRAGKFAPARLAHWQAAYDRDEAGTREYLDTVEAGLVPVAPLGFDGEGADTADEALFAQLFPELASAGK